MEQQKNSMRSKNAEEFQAVTPFIIAKNAQKFIEFTEEAFGAKKTYEMKTSDGKIMHATIKIGNSTIMIADEMNDYPAFPAMLYLYVDDVDQVYKNALQANAESIREPLDEFYGDRSAGVKDAWNNQWWIATHVEDVSDEEIEKRAKEFEKKS